MRFGERHRGLPKEGVFPLPFAVMGGMYERKDPFSSPFDLEGGSRVRVGEREAMGGEERNSQALEVQFLVKRRHH